jgi:hypothetical protein
MKHDPGKSDRPVVPQKPPNKADAPEASAAEVVEGRGLAEGNPQEQNSSRAQYRTKLTHELGVSQHILTDKSPDGARLSLCHDIGTCPSGSLTVNASS